MISSYNERAMSRRIRILFFIFLTPAIAPAEVRKIVVNAPIHPITSEYVVGAVRNAERANARLLIIGLNSPGGLDTSMREIIEAVVNAKVPVAAYVSPSGARAASAGFFIGVACDVFAMAPGTNTGAAHPVGISITGQAMDKTMGEKVTHDAAAYIKSLAAKRGRNVAMAEDAVRKSLSYTEEEALRGGLIDLVAANDGDLIAALDGKVLKRFGGGETTLALAGETVVEIPMSFRQRFLLTISNPNLAYILLMIGLLGLYFEFANPGAVLPGVLGGISLLLAIFSFQILPINYVGLLLIVLAVALFVLEVKVHSYGALSVGGIVALLIGSMMLIDSPVPELRPSLRLIVPVALGISLVCIFLVTLVVRAQARRAITGREGMIGEIGTARTDLAPAGTVFVHGGLWAAESDGPVREGERVRVIAFGKGLKIKVTKEST
jgi:membrane-bound serine protease (ClpP class)